MKPPEELTPEPQLAFLFLTRGEVHHPKIWEEYWMQVGQRPRILAHTKDTTLLSGESFLSDRQISDKVETAWGELSIVHATLALLRAALQDPETTHFILVSESCVPVRPFGQLRVNLRRDSRSRLHVWSLDEVKRAGNRYKLKRLLRLHGISMDLAFFQEQWMCLNREDALTVTRKDWTACFQQVEAADECYFATVLAASGKSLSKGTVNRAITWTDWQQGAAHPEEYTEVPPQVACRIAESGCYFARKFPPGSDIAKWGLHRDNPCVKPDHG
jgi:hypothetical protein